LPSRAQSLPSISAVDEVLIQFAPHFWPGVEDPRLYGCDGNAHACCDLLIERPSIIEFKDAARIRLSSASASLSIRDLFWASSPARGSAPNLLRHPETTCHPISECSSMEVSRFRGLLAELHKATLIAMRESQVENRKASPWKSCR